MGISEADAGVNGKNVTKVYRGTNGKTMGVFRNTAPKTWREESLTDAGRRTFTEIFRDEWSVYLMDRGQYVQLDLYQKKIYMANDRNFQTGRRVIWNITGVSAEPQGPKVPTLAAPSNNATLPNMAYGKTYTWNFSWSAVPGASQYQLDVRGKNAFNPYINQNVYGTSFSKTSRPKSYVASHNLNGWMWKVRAMVNGKWQPWTQVRTFNVRPVITEYLPNHEDTFVKVFCQAGYVATFSATWYGEMGTVPIFLIGWAGMEELISPPRKGYPFSAKSISRSNHCPRILQR